ncbi:MAG TPA: hypothetical protein VF628_07615 [Allosphingosinicella sp.]|jgi:predicted lipid-binding transport protein (Tim44 family)
MLTALALITAPAIAAKGPKPAKSEVSKAIGKCIGAVLGGALLGALIGGRRNRGEGAAIGAGAGAAACAVLVAAAKRQDRIIEAQRAAAAAGDGQVHWASFRDENGKEMRIASQAQDINVTQSLVPVSFEVNGAQRVSPDLGTAPRVCRQTSSALSGDSGNATISGQIYCRTADGSYEPYALGKA